MGPGIRVLVVDDSAVVREALRQLLAGAPEIAEVETAADGRTALKKVMRFDPDVVTMDVEMPGQDGLVTLRELMANAPRPVLMLSAFTFSGARKTLRALELGAVDFIQKPGGPGSRDMQSIGVDLIAKLVELGRGERRRARLRPDILPERRATLRPKLGVQAMAGSRVERVVVVGASTGGTEAIRHTLCQLRSNFPLPIAIVQHMPEGFTLAFANRMNELCALEVKEACHRDLLLPGRVLIAPGHSHMTVHREGGVGFVELNRHPPVNRHRPSVDVLFDSAVRSFGAQALGVLLTGMGRDGAQGLLELHRLGAPTIAESAESCVVFGMPKAAIDLGAAEHVCACDEIPGLLETLTTTRRTAGRPLAQETEIA